MAVGIVGRDAELAALGAVCTAAVAGRGSALVVVGEPGVGKTALLAAATEGSNPWRTVKATGVEAERGVAFASLQALLWPVRDVVDELEATQRAVLRGILELGPSIESSAFAVGAAVLALVSIAAEAQPLVVVLDDAQWLDGPSQEVVCFVGRRLEGESVALLAGARGEEPSLLTEERAFAQLHLQPLGHAAALALLERVSADLALEVAERLIELSGGNPLGLVELPRLLTDAQLGGREPLADALAAGPLVQRAFAARAGRLGPVAREALLVVAAAGEAGPALRALDEHERAALDEAEAAGLVSRSGTVEFRHPLMRAAVYGAASPAARRAAHRRLAAVVDGPRRAWQLADAADGPDETVALALEEAGVAARHAGGRIAEAHAFERAAALTADTDRRADRLLHAAQAWLLAGRGDRAGELLDQALPLAGSARTRAEIQLARGRALVRALDFSAAEELLLREAELAAATEPALAARLLAAAAQAADLRPDPKLAIELAERACALLPSPVGQAELEAVTALITARTSSGTPPDERDAALLEHAVELLENRELRAGSETAHWIAYCLALHERDEEAERLSDRALAEARATGDVWTLCFGLYARAGIVETMGRVDAMDAWAREALPLAEQIGEPWRVLEARTFFVGVEASRGNPEGCLQALEASGGYLAPNQSTLVRSFHLGRAYLAAGLSAEAIFELEAAAGYLETGGILVWYRQIPLELAEAYASAGRARDAGAQVRAVAAGIERCGLKRPLAKVARVRALLAPEARVDAAFASALTVLEEAPHPLEQARVELGWGERLSDIGRADDAVPHLERALTGFTALGANGWAERTRRSLAGASGSTRPAQPRRSDELSAQELRIARHAAAGLRNREIAAALYLSPRTVETHLLNAYRKLDVGNRTQLAAVLAADGVRPIVLPADSVAPTA